MSIEINVARRAHHWLALLSISLIVITTASNLDATAATLAGSASLSWLAQADDLAKAVQLNNEVVRLLKAGKYDEATPLAEGVLAIYEKALGPDHPGVATALNNLASLYYEKGDYAKTEPLYLRMLDIHEKALGP